MMDPQALFFQPMVPPASLVLPALPAAPAVPLKAAKERKKRTALPPGLSEAEKRAFRREANKRFAR
jgi:hypothetical protein